MICEKENHSIQATDLVWTYTINKEIIPPGAQKEFDLKAKISQKITNCTAIGKAAARYYILHLETSYGCCSNSPQAKLHLFIQSKTPTIQKINKYQLPENWSPKIFPKITCQTLKPYIYGPHPKILYLNFLNQKLIFHNNPINPNQNNEIPLKKSENKKNQNKYQIHQPYFSQQNSLNSLNSKR